MVNSEFTKDIGKALKDTNVSSEIMPGDVKRRYEPKLGLNKHNERIHKESAKLDRSGNLPFTFGKKKVAPGRPVVKCCANCENVVGVNEKTVGIICPKCKTYSSVKDLQERVQE